MFRVSQFSLIFLLGLTVGIQSKSDQCLEVFLTSDDATGCNGTCPTWDGDISEYLAHRDCTKFCQCSFGIPYVFKCPAGLHFNAELKVCDHPSHAGCAPKKPITTVLQSSYPKVPLSKKKPIVGNDNSGCEGSCSTSGEDKVEYLAHKNCSKFCQCSFGIPWVFECPADLHFNAELKVCDHPSHAGCAPKEPITTVPQSSYPKVSLSRKKSILRDNTDDTSGCKGRCPTWEGDKVVHLAHKDCTKFCKCDFGIPYVFQCPSGLHFNSKLGVCDRPSHAGCVPKP